jgi:hypothetical protein
MGEFGFLRRVFAVDALTTIAAAAGLLLAAGPVGSLTGYSQALIWSIGLVMLGLGAFIGWLASRQVPPAPLVWVVIVGNLLWMAESAVLLAQVGPFLTGFGIAVTAAQAGWVALMGGLEYIGLKRGRLAAA